MNQNTYRPSTNKAPLRPEHKRPLLFILVIVAFLCYSNTIGHDFAYDDFSVITQNTIVTKGFEAVPQIFSTPYRSGFFITSNDLYRPLPLAMFAVEYQLFDGSPSPFHFINILLYIGCVLILFLFLDALFEKKRTMLAFIAALLFAVHPVHTEVVANIKSRDELLCFFFALAGLKLCLSYRDEGKLKQLLAAALMYFLSLLSKETSIALIAIAPLCLMLYRNKPYKKAALILAAIALPVLIFLGIRYSVLSSWDANHIDEVLFTDNFLSGLSAFERLPTAIYILGLYLQKLVIPYPLVSDYSYKSIPLVGWGNARVWLSLLAHLVLLSFAISRLYRSKKDPAAFGILFYLFSIALFSNIFFLTGAAFAERFVFFASAGFCIAIAQVITGLGRLADSAGLGDILRNKRIGIVLPSLLAVLLIITVNRNNDWKNNTSLFYADIKKSPQNIRLNFFLANEIFQALGSGNIPNTEAPAKFGEAIAYLKNATNIYPKYTDAYKALGKGFASAGFYDSAIYYYDKALSLRKNDLEAMSDLDVVYFNQKNYRSSIDICRRILAIDPAQVEKYRNIGLCFIQLAQYDSALLYLKNGASLSANPGIFYPGIASAYQAIGKPDSAEKYSRLSQ
jgi:tetratricopeptide (TPR) repeat protein